MIVRISTEGQYRIPDEDAERLRELDDELTAAVEDDDDERFHELFEEILTIVRSDGELLPDDELIESDVILPPPDVTLEEAKHEFGEEGLITD